MCACICIYIYIQLVYLGNRGILWNHHRYITPRSPVVENFRRGRAVKRGLTGDSPQQDTHTSYPREGHRKWIQVPAVVSRTPRKNFQEGRAINCSRDAMLYWLLSSFNASSEFLDGNAVNFTTRAYLAPRLLVKSYFGRDKVKTSAGEPLKQSSPYKYAAGEKDK